MLKFDADSIYNRLVDRLKQDPEWNAVINNSVISSVLRSNAETNAETARYAEYLFRESKWDTAQNNSSILAMAGILGYKPKRKVSAIGNIYVSLDPRIHQIGSVYPSNYILDKSSNGTANWKAPTSDVIVSTSNIITDTLGNSYIPVSGSLSNGAKVSQISILQGIRKSLNIPIATIKNVATFSKLDPYLYIPFEIKNCENASGSISSAFFKVFVEYQNNQKEKQFRVVDSLLFSKSSDFDVEVYNDLYSTNLFYLKFNNDSSRGSVLDISRSSNIKNIRVEYVESKGAKGNVSNIFTKFTIPNVSYNNSFVNLYGVNLEAIVGGKDEETVSDIKVQAPKYYISNYTAGTQEAYERAILNLEIPVTVDDRPTVLKPLKVKVYGEEITANNVVQRVTKVVFTAAGLEDIAASDEAPSKIEQALNYYLSRLKAPQDKLVFEFPNYIAFALGVKCKVSKDSSIDLSALESSIKQMINNQWGSSSTYLDFGRNFYPGNITHLIKSNYPDVVTTDIEVEAVKKIDWDDVIRIESHPGNTADSAVANHTMRLNFDFSNIFRGSENHKGFKDVRTGSSYVMRVDFMYKKPTALSTTQDYHTSLFITDNINRNTSGLSSFYICKNPNKVWDESQFGKDNYNYSMLNDSSCFNLTSSSKQDSLTHAYQYYYKAKVYNDNDFNQLKEDTESAIETTINSHLQHLGAVDDYLAYFESDYDSNNNKSKVAAKGWIEIGFEPIYNLLSTFSLYNVDLRDKMSRCTLSTLKCDQYAEDFSTFVSILKDWVDIYVSLRPIDSDILLDSFNSSNSNSILYIDSFDEGQLSQNQNLTNAKLARMISVDCKYEG